jgi:hypothetical protein
LLLHIYGFNQAGESVPRQKGIRRENGSAFYHRCDLEQKQIPVIIDQNGNYDSFQFSQGQCAHFFLLCFEFERSLGFFLPGEQKSQHGVVEGISLFN